MAIEYDPLDPAQVDDHQSVLSRLRREAPVSELKPGLFYLARYQDVMDVCRSPQVFRQGRHIPRHLDTRSEDQLNLGETDPPEHVRVRKVLAALLTPSKVRAMEPLIRKTCETLVDRFAGRGVLIPARQLRTAAWFSSHRLIFQRDDHVVARLHPQRRLLPPVIIHITKGSPPGSINPAVERQRQL